MFNAIIEIILMLLVSALVGFLIAWYIRKKKVEELEEYNAVLKREINGLHADLEDIKTNVENTEEKAVTKEVQTLQRIKEKAKDIDFNKIGTASEEEKNDLKIIKGVGPFIEKKLNVLGIYTFRQIASFDDEDKEKVNEAIEFFPGRIKRDNWVGQAKELCETL